MNNRVLQIGGIISFLFSLAAVLMGLPSWMIVIGITLTAVLHLYYVPDIARQDENADGIFEQENNEDDLFSPDKLLRIKEQYEQRIRSLEIEKDRVIENLTVSLEIKDKELNEKITEIQSNADKEVEQAKKEAEDLANANATSILPVLPDGAERPVRIEMCEFARKSVAEFEKESKQAGVNINVADSGDKLYIRASSRMLRVLFRDIIDNAIKYMKRRGTLQITIANLDDDIFIAMKDNGEGLAENETKHIFELNYQGSNRISGNGLGLAQAKAIVEYYGGMIYAKSALGRGMGIYIHLPAEKEDM